MKSRLSLGVALALSLGAAAPAARAADLTDATFEQVRDAILPKPAELAFCDIGWRPTLWEAVLEADRADKPVLLWAMNGHPLGCT